MGVKREVILAEHAELFRPNDGAALRLGLAGQEDYARHFDTNRNSEIEALVSLLTTHHTFFFRESQHFDYLIDQGLKEAVARVRKRGERTLRVWCAADAGLVINPDGALNQLEGGIIQAASWALKEGVRLDTGGISSRDWESYPVLRFSEVPEVLVELVNPSADLPPLGVGEASGGTTVAAIGNAVAHALGARLRDLPLTRDRVIMALLKL